MIGGRSIRALCSKEGTLAGQFYASQRRDWPRMHAMSFANSLTVSEPDGYDVSMCAATPA